MARGPKLVDTERDRIRELIEAGESRNAIAKAVGRSGDTVSRIAAEFGHVFGQSNGQNARAREAYCDELRESLRLRLLAEAHGFLDQLHEPVTVWAFIGGEGAGFYSRQLDKPDPKAKRDLMTSMGIAADKAEAIKKNNAIETDDGAKGALLQLFGAMGITVDDSTPNPEGDG